MTDCIRYGTGYKYQLRAGYAVRIPELADPERLPIVTDWIDLDPDGTLRIRPGYAWDGASGPTYDSKSSMRPSLVHDALYQLMRMELLDREQWRDEADAIFRRMCKEDGMWSLLASVWHFMVRRFADPAADPASQAPDECAPCACEVCK